MPLRIGEGKVKLLHGDCLELMRGIPDKSIDMILCEMRTVQKRAGIAYEDDAKAKEQIAQDSASAMGIAAPEKEPAE